jgi:hypothetical protein
MLRTRSHYKSSGSVNNPRHLTLTGKLSKLSLEKSIDEEEEKEFESNFKDERLSQEDLKIFRNSTTRKHKTHKISALVNVDVSADKRKQIKKNIEIELTYQQGQIIKSMQVVYNPENIFCKLPGEDDEIGSKIAKSRLFQFEIEGSRYSKPKSDIEKGIFNRGTSYFIVVHKHVKHNKSLDFNSNNVIFLWKGDQGMNLAKNSIEKFISTPFQEIKLKSGPNKRDSERKSEFITQSSKLMKRATMAPTIGQGFGLGVQKPKGVKIF